MYMDGQVYHGTHVESRGQLVEMGSLFLNLSLSKPCGAWGIKPRYSFLVASIFTELLHCHNCSILLVATADHLTEPKLYLRWYRHRFAVSGSRRASWTAGSLRARETALSLFGLELNAKGFSNGDKRCKQA